ncbi:unnamed protein product [Ceutorhynchus assimilis]|uniref:DRBM domain-containing protein n=1 Tax=Ceutorhynchus assimilis TaxID=467358 RepID=A0A9N9MAV7_9CUCU|nr:unnamed protein product [Ceutorhynchus assimilis]
MGENDTTPVAALQELAVKGGFRKPYYELMSQSIGSDTDTSRFQCLVTAAGIKASGSGWSKQTSKNQAAQRVLMKMGIEVPYETPATFFFKMASRASEEALKREKSKYL